MIKPFDELPIHVLDELITHKIGSQWHVFDNNTLSLEMGIMFSSLLLDKISFLKVLKADVDIVYTDVLAFTHGCEVVNNEEVFEENVPMPTCLELGYFLNVLERYPPTDPGLSPAANPMIRRVSQFVLKQEGFSGPVAPFDFLSKEEISPEGEAHTEDLKQKEMGVKAYIEYMNSIKDVKV